LSFSLHLGMTPDSPFPGGNVNRVVKGVRIHPLVAPVASTID
jgi:tagatose-6-phosphate ketose/aldose isomerase